jgi:hydroxypyruvate isomerase
MSISKDNLVVNLSFLFTEKPFMERFAAVKETGLKRVEFMFPYDYNLDEIANQLKIHDLELVLFNLPAGDWGNGERGIAVNPNRQREFRDGVSKAIEAALKLGVKQVNCLVGKILPDLTWAEQWSTLIANIRYAAEQFETEGIRLLIEPLNHFDIPGFFLNTTNDVLELISKVNHENVYLQFDVYHAIRESENIFKVLQESLPKIGHIQIADNPGRHQPGTGEIDYKTFFSALKKAGYSHAIAMEYVPEPDTVTSLEWIKNFSE